MEKLTDVIYKLYNLYNIYFYQIFYNKQIIDFEREKEIVVVQYFELSDVNPSLIHPTSHSWLR